MPNNDITNVMIVSMNEKPKIKHEGLQKFGFYDLDFDSL
jgi:hypothetical protein